MALTTAGYIAVAFLAAGTALSIRGQQQQAAAAEKAAGEQRKQNAINNAQQSIARNREVRQVIARQRVLQAEQQQAGFGSGFSGAVSAIGADTASAIGAAQTQQAAASGIAASQDRFSRYATEAQSPNNSTIFGGALSSIGQFGLSGGFGAVTAGAGAAGSSLQTGYASNRPLGL